MKMQPCCTHASPLTTEGQLWTGSLGLTKPIHLPEPPWIHKNSGHLAAAAPFQMHSPALGPHWDAAKRSGRYILRGHGHDCRTPETLRGPCLRGHTPPSIGTLAGNEPVTPAGTHRQLTQTSSPGHTLPNRHGAYAHNLTHHSPTQTHTLHMETRITITERAGWSCPLSLTSPGATCSARGLPPVPADSSWPRQTQTRCHTPGPRRSPTHPDTPPGSWPSHAQPVPGPRASPGCAPGPHTPAVARALATPS